MTKSPLELAIIGAGPCGIAAGVSAVKRGVSTLLLDQGFITDSLVKYPPYMTFFSTAEKLEIGGIPFVVPREKPTRLDALVYYRRVVEHFGLRVRQHTKVAGIRREQGGFRLSLRTRHGEEEPLEARAVVMATGGFHRPNMLEVPGEDLGKVFHHYTEAHPFFDQEVLMVGGGNSAVEAALELFRARARVTMVHFQHTLDPGVKPWILPDIRNRLEKGEIGMYWGHRVAEIRPGAVLVVEEGSERTREVANDWVFALTGWRGDPSLLEEVGVEVDPESGIPTHDPESMETNVPGVFLAGVVAAGHDANRIFIENGRDHGERILAALQHRSP